MDWWLWLAMLVTGVAGGALSLVGTAIQRRAAGHDRSRAGNKLMFASYVLMSVSMLLFAVRGLA